MSSQGWSKNNVKSKTSSILILVLKVFYHMSLFVIKLAFSWHQIICYLLFLDLYLTKVKSKRHITSVTLNLSSNTIYWTQLAFRQRSCLLRIKLIYPLLRSPREMNIWHIDIYKTITTICLKQVLLLVYLMNTKLPHLLRQAFTSLILLTVSITFFMIIRN